MATDPTGRTDGDPTTWAYHDATGLVTQKTYADGSQVVQSWDAFNRPVRFEKEDESEEGPTVIECGYDYLGRRYMKRVTQNGVVTKHERYIYRGYLQIAALDLKRETHPALWYILWDPTEAIATRPLAIQKDGTWYTYGHDLTKNVWELYKANGTIATAYNYAPFGEVTTNGTAEQPFQWSSEFYDSELGMVHYNFRFYNPLDGRWISRDPMEEERGANLYGYADNNSVGLFDILGMAPSRREIERLIKQVKALLRKVEARIRRRSAACCELYEQYLSLLAELTQKAAEFYADQYWITEKDEKAMWEVYGLPTIAGGEHPSMEQLKKQKEAAEKARENINNNIFNKHGEAIHHGVNWGSGLSDSLSLGADRLLAKWVNGENSRWGDTDAGGIKASSGFSIANQAARV